MQPQPDWATALKIMATGITLVFVVMTLLAVITWLMGKFFNKGKKEKK